ncbi:hypothetical protein [Mycolicibacterium brumae]|uniref:Uncharacterized protein n=1 Tax=Mycolicibacterium brumae TaxID=85968 RepID=A0A2G5PCJ5_9MYCO|nr:hypothetical protein [Mycolicibacterium brumae]MCV7193470.1 hypothetical protein [Mycolicibacterium brumae]PIB76056.1 hypothetical protein CQY22_006595 [Mycolicibacterium brumae]RWA17169.1 hypothetical protein MBRU_05975 [Mycolicibacterium brumae DSM 44177]UWW09257.1 hypothetical protein L2Z93_002350 [Mycolicibacterium brumae]
MLTAIAIIPSPPVLVPELVGSAAGEFTELRAAALAAAGALPPRWVAVGTGSPAVIDGGAVGSFGGYGADVTVSLSARADAPVTELPLCALITGWIRGRVDPAATAEVRCFPADIPAGEAVAAGAQLRAEFDRSPQRIGVLIVADGCATLTPAAPGGFDPGAEAIQRDLDAALAAADAAALADLPDAVVGRAPLAVLSGLAGRSQWEARELYRGAPLGVGYFAGIWLPGEPAPCDR